MPLTYFRGFFNQLFNRHVFCLLYKGDIIALYHSNTHDKLKDDQKDQLRNFAAETGMPCGISRSFTSLFDINTCYRQGKEAIDSGKRVDPGRFLFFYEDYVMQDIIHICSMHDSLHNFCHPGLLKLIEFDTANNTAYTDTLRSYVMHFKNPSDLAKKLKVHRNTLYYRLNKIEEIMDHTLDSMDTLYNLYLSFKIIEYSGIQR